MLNISFCIIIKYICCTCSIIYFTRIYSIQSRYFLLYICRATCTVHTLNIKSLFFHIYKKINKNYFLVLTSHTLTSSSINCSTSTGFLDTSFFFPQHARCFLRTCLFASLRSQIAALICVAISIQYASSASNDWILVSMPCAFFTAVSTFLCFINR